MPHDEIIKYTKKAPVHGDGSAAMFWVASVLKAGGAGLSSEGGTVREHDTEFILNMGDQWVIFADRVRKVMIILSPAQISRGETANMVGSTVMGVARSSMRGGKTRALIASERTLVLSPPPRGSVGLEIKTILTALGASSTATCPARATIVARSVGPPHFFSASSSLTCCSRRSCLTRKPRP